MKADELYRLLTELSEKLNIPVEEHNFKNAGIKVKSGFCNVKGKDLFILNKHLPLKKKNEILLEFIAMQNLDNVYVAPAVREKLGLIIINRSGAN
ncbi:MAG: hypothetical protein K9L30_09235 [Desulfobacterales bacterium]|nr:hypothetical protein [Desulfobacterales bacterium]